jgi:hypothetical protein
MQQVHALTSLSKVGVTPAADHALICRRTLPPPDGSGMPSPATRMLSPGVTISSSGTDSTLPAAAATIKTSAQHRMRLSAYAPN